MDYKVTHSQLEEKLFGKKERGWKTHLDIKLNLPAYLEDTSLNIH